MQKKLDKGKHRSSSGSASVSKSGARAPLINGLLREESSGSSASAKSGRSQLVDLVVEDKDAAETERVRARKEGGAAWNTDEPTHFV